MTGIGDWQGGVGRTWAAEHARTDRSFAGLTPHLLATIAAQAGERIVDLGCGAGELTRAVAQALSQADVTGVDVSADLIAAAQAHPDQPANARFVLADATQWTHPAGAVDLYVSRHGVMFFPDPPTAFAHMARVAAPQGRIVFSCFRSAQENAWASGIARLLPAAAQGAPAVAAPAFPPGPFAFADPDRVRRCMAGWRDFVFTPVDFAYVAGQGDDPVADALDFFRRIGPAAAALRTLPDELRGALEQDILQWVAANVRLGHVAFDAAAWIVTASVDHTMR